MCEADIATAAVLQVVSGVCELDSVNSPRETSLDPTREWPQQAPVSRRQQVLSFSRPHYTAMTQRAKLRSWTQSAFATPPRPARKSVPKGFSESAVLAQNRHQSNAFWEHWAKVPEAPLREGASSTSSTSSASSHSTTSTSEQGKGAVDTAKKPRRGELAHVIVERTPPNQPSKAGSARRMVRDEGREGGSLLSSPKGD